MSAPDIQIELLGPEYSIEFSSLNAALKVFLSRAWPARRAGLMPVVEN
jgi:hypothetical protein